MHYLPTAQDYPVLAAVARHPPGAVGAVGVCTIGLCMAVAFAASSFFTLAGTSDFTITSFTVPASVFTIPAGWSAARVSQGGQALAQHALCLPVERRLPPPLPTSGWLQDTVHTSPIQGRMHCTAQEYRTDILCERPVKARLSVTE